MPDVAKTRGGRNTLCGGELLDETYDNTIRRIRKTQNCEALTQLVQKQLAWHKFQKKNEKLSTILTTLGENTKTTTNNITATTTFKKFSFHTRQSNETSFKCERPQKKEERNYLPLYDVGQKTNYNQQSKKLDRSKQLQQEQQKQLLLHEGKRAQQQNHKELPRKRKIHQDNIEAFNYNNDKNDNNKNKVSLFLKLAVDYYEQGYLKNVRYLKSIGQRNRQNEKELENCCKSPLTKEFHLESHDSLETLSNEQTITINLESINKNKTISLPLPTTETTATATIATIATLATLETLATVELRTKPASETFKLIYKKLKNQKSLKKTSFFCWKHINEKSPRSKNRDVGLLRTHIRSLEGDPFEKYLSLTETKVNLKQELGKANSCIRKTETNRQDIQTPQGQQYNLEEDSMNDYLNANSTASLSYSSHASSSTLLNNNNTGSSTSLSLQNQLISYNQPVQTADKSLDLEQNDYIQYCQDPSNNFHDLIDNLNHLQLNDPSSFLLPRITLTDYSTSNILHRNHEHPDQNILKQTKFLFNQSLEIPYASEYQSEARPP